jgi:hypothetical protein
VNYVKPGNGWTVDSVLVSIDNLTLTNQDIMHWFNMRVRGNPELAPDHCQVELYSLLEEADKLLYAQ